MLSPGSAETTTLSEVENWIVI